MSSERFQRVKEIFQTALDRPIEERAAFLDGRCGDDPELRAEVERLLASDSAEDGFLETPATTGLPPGLSTAPLVGARVGHYLLERVISSGGMGTVYEAVQEKPLRTVAVKVMKQTMVSASALRRFEYEAQILARLRHPGIAQVIEAGTHLDEGGAGLPYFVMEYIEGARSLTEYAGERNLSSRERIELFTRVCDAVHYGHQRGVIHRDLKPGNILVDAQGREKIIDFGVARATDADLALTTMLTEAGQLLGTLQYMSPEQCGGDPHDVDTRSDLYSLGVVLYELLCGALPYDVRETAVVRAARLIQEEPPRRPSLIDRRLRGDVETILLKSLEKERRLRYQTAAEFGADLRRHLRGEVILARPAGLGTRLYKGVKRNPVLSAAFGVAAVCLSAFILYVVLYSYPRIREEKAKLEKEVENTRLANEFLEEMFTWVDPYREGGEVKVSELLDRAARRIDEKFPDRPEIEASIRLVLGTTYFNNGRYGAAEKQLKRSLELYRGLHGDDHEDTLSAMSNLAFIYEKQDRYEKAEPLMKEALEGQRRVLGENHMNTLRTLTTMGSLYQKQNRYDESESYFQEALEKQQRYLGDDHEVTLATISDLACLYKDLGRYEEAEVLYNKVLENRRRVLSEDHPSILLILNNLAALYVELGRFGEAEPLLKETLERQRRVLGEEHTATLTTMSNLGSLYEKKGQYDEAEKLFSKVLEIKRLILSDGNPEILNSIHRLAGAKLALGRYGEAERLYREALEGYRRVFGDDHRDTLATVHSLATLYWKQKRYKEAEPLYKEALEGRRRMLGDDHASTLSTQSSLATLYCGLKRYEEAEALFEKTLDGTIRRLGESHPRTLMVMNNLASLYLDQGRYGEAESMFLKVIDIYREVLEADHPDLLSSLNNLAALYYRRKRYDKAEPLMKEALDGRRRRLGDDHPQTVGAMWNMASLYYCLGRYREAKDLAVKVVKRTPEEGSEYQDRVKLLGMIRKALGDEE